MLWKFCLARCNASTHLSSPGHCCVILLFMKCCTFSTGDGFGLAAGQTLTLSVKLCLCSHKDIVLLKCA